VKRDIINATTTILVIGSTGKAGKPIADSFQP
jgi:hypothetical protein